MYSSLVIVLAAEAELQRIAAPVDIDLRCSAVGPPVPSDGQLDAERSLSERVESDAAVRVLELDGVPEDKVAFSPQLPAGVKRKLPEASTKVIRELAEDARLRS